MSNYEYRVETDEDGKHWLAERGGLKAGPPGLEPRAEDVRGYLGEKGFEVELLKGRLQLIFPLQRRWDDDSLVDESLRPEEDRFLLDGDDLQWRRGRDRFDGRVYAAGSRPSLAITADLAWVDEDLKVSCQLEVRDAPPPPDGCAARLTLGAESVCDGEIESSTFTCRCRPALSSSGEFDVRLEVGGLEAETTVRVPGGFARPELADQTAPEVFATRVADLRTVERIRFLDYRHAPDEIEVTLCSGSLTVAAYKGRKRSATDAVYALVEHGDGPAGRPRIPVVLEVKVDGEPSGQVWFLPDNIEGYLRRTSRGADFVPRSLEINEGRLVTLDDEECDEPRFPEGKCPHVILLKDAEATVDDRHFDPLFLQQPLKLYTALTSSGADESFPLELVDVEGKKVRAPRLEVWYGAAEPFEVEGSIEPSVREKLHHRWPLLFQLDGGARQAIAWMQEGIEPDRLEEVVDGSWKSQSEIYLFFRGFLLRLRSEPVELLDLEGREGRLLLVDGPGLLLDGSLGTAAGAFLPLRTARLSDGLRLWDPPHHADLRIETSLGDAARQVPVFESGQEAWPCGYLSQGDSRYQYSQWPTDQHLTGVVWGHWVVDPESLRLRGWIDAIDDEGSAFPAQGRFPGFGNDVHLELELDAEGEVKDWQGFDEDHREELQARLREQVAQIRPRSRLDDLGILIFRRASGLKATVRTEPTPAVRFFRRLTAHKKETE